MSASLMPILTRACVKRGRDGEGELREVASLMAFVIECWCCGWIHGRTDVRLLWEMSLDEDIGWDGIVGFLTFSFCVWLYYVGCVHRWVALGLTPEHDTQIRDGFTMLMHLSKKPLWFSTTVHSKVLMRNDTVWQTKSSL
jgi:hypothetical protein